LTMTSPSAATSSPISLRQWCTYLILFDNDFDFRHQPPAKLP
jgi:hypothetical protein